ncbi:heme-binding protein [Salmonella enterica]|uniref:Heme-binding protein n=1 Tax=Salmonella enterica subsp. diarizonae serovar 48:i:z TaxID=1192842 RepID=A0A7U5YJ43_SALDZ|nr:heme-binding protein [Salmonella enterica]EAA4453296.1 heme-binding protein [Salmonella enterica subsp. diarizonae]EDW6116921.1 heme-binding protein [Salmonella enterica subsp. salamae]AXC73853.1 heme-binding protein [Salmonella enterica subsp. diarizonae serovar 48:i:z]EAM2672873.1 heme-binding protein [Salmonella enterica]EAM6404585.1 heme-binding protein [Salmonella enterica]
MTKYVVLSGLLACVSFAAFAAPLSQPNISLQQANRITEAAITACQQKGYNVSVTVVDRSGITLAMQRMDNAGPHTVDASYKKAWTALSTRTPTGKVMENAQKNPGAQHLSDIKGFLLLAGGLPIKSGSDVIGAIGVGGAPGGNLDESCALEAIEKTKDK